MIIQLIPAYTPMWAVHAGPDGEVVFTQVVCIGLVEHTESGQRFPAPIIPWGEHLNMASPRREHVGYVASPPMVTEELEKKCKDRRMALNAAEAEAAKKKGPQIIVPDKRVVTAKDLAN